MESASNAFEGFNAVKPSGVCDEAAVSHCKNQENVNNPDNIPDAKQSTQMADVKHELKSRIYSRRLAKGLDDFEIPTTTDDTPIREQLTKEDEEKRRQRRERNRVAAAKCRERKKIKMERLSWEAENLKEENEVLTMDIRALQLEKDNLLRKLCSHHCVLTGKGRVERKPSGDLHVKKEKTDNDSD